jgi:ATP-dependent RNA helicase SUPV3L1/SUV3
VAEVNINGEVTIDGQFIGKLQGFRFLQDKGGSSEEDKMIRSSGIAALEPEFHLRSARFYNAPDTEIDFTEQGGLMWGEHAVGKLIAGENIMNPQVSAFVDDEAGLEVKEKVERRLKHFVDRKIATLFEPLTLMQKDENITGLSKGLAFRLVESLGIVPRLDIINELKDMDQESRALLRKHGVRFGQFNIFLPILLKPAVTRMRLVLWSLKKNFTEFPSAPTAGLVTISANNDEAEGYFVKAGYHFAGDWALRIDMVERLADLIRKENTHAGFEASSDMLSITGMTNEQFASLMAGLGYDVKKGEREKKKKLISEAEEIDKIPGMEDSINNQEIAEAITEIFWSFTWQNKKIKNKTLIDVNLSENPNKHKKPKKTKSNYSNKKNKNKKQIEKETPPDPNNPFAVLLALKES